MSRIIDDLLDLSRIESEETPPREPIHINLVDGRGGRAGPGGRRATPHHHRDRRARPADRTSSATGASWSSAIHSLLENAVTFSYEDTVVEVAGSQADGDDVS